MKLNTEKCRQWAKERGLLGEKPDTSKQFQKLASECMEFLDEINKGNLENAYLEFGDVLVTMIIYCEQRGLGFERVAEFIGDNCRGIDLGLAIISDLGFMASNEGRLKFSTLIATSSLCRIFGRCKIIAPQFDPQKALDLAVEKISNRKTTVVNGTVVKEGDLIHNGFGECVGDWSKDGNYITEEYKINKDTEANKQVFEKYIDDLRKGVYDCKRGNIQNSGTQDQFEEQRGLYLKTNGLD